MKSGTWKVRSLYRSGSVTTVARDLARYKLDLVGVQKFKWNKGGMVRAGITFVLLERTRNLSIGNSILCTTQKIISSYGSTVC
jgi:hypothetical protein